MPVERAPRGAFEWNAGGWFGGQLGATLWLVLLGALLCWRAHPVGVWILLLGLLPNAIGLALWRRRAHLAPYPALQILLASCGLCALIAMLALRAAAPPERSAELPSLWLLALYPGLMIAFHLRQRAARPPSG